MCNIQRFNQAQIEKHVELHGREADNLLACYCPDELKAECLSYKL